MLQIANLQLNKFYSPKSPFTIFEFITHNQAPKTSIIPVSLQTRIFLRITRKSARISTTGDRRGTECSGPGNAESEQWYLCLIVQIMAFDIFIMNSLGMAEQLHKSMLHKLIMEIDNMLELARWIKASKRQVTQEELKQVFPEVLDDLKDILRQSNIEISKDLESKLGKILNKTYDLERQLEKHKKELLEYYGKDTQDQMDQADQEDQKNDQARPCLLRKTKRIRKQSNRNGSGRKSQRNSTVREEQSEYQSESEQSEAGLSEKSDYFEEEAKVPRKNHKNPMRDRPKPQPEPKSQKQQQFYEQSGDSHQDFYPLH